MMDYDRIRTEAGARKQTLLARQKDIPKEKQKLDEEMEQIKRELIGIDQILDGVAFMDSSIPTDFEPEGFTDNVRKILSETTLPLVPTQIRDALEAKGIMGSSSKNLLINVHKVLERIDSELDKTQTAEGKTAYKRKIAWTVPRLAALAGLSGDTSLDPLIGLYGLSAPGKLAGAKLPTGANTRTLADLAGNESSNHPLRKLAEKPDDLHPIHHLRPPRKR
jgi:hypothetical protein